MLVLLQARAGLESSADALALSLAFSDESPASNFVWRDVLGNLDRVRQLVSERNAFDAEGELLSRFVRSLLTPAMNKLQWSPQLNECKCIHL